MTMAFPDMFAMRSPERPRNWKACSFCADLPHESKHLSLSIHLRRYSLGTRGYRRDRRQNGKIVSEISGRYGIASKHGTPQPCDIVELAEQAVNIGIDRVNLHL